MNKVLLHVEGLVVFLLSTYLYFYMQFNWGVFVLLLFAPDLAALGYIINNKIGSVMYNLFHTYSVPAIIIICNFWMQNHLLLMVSLIWVAHIGMDRLFGYGLKYSTGFKDTHLDRI